MEPERQRLSFEERSNLVAFLDGELGKAEADALAEKVARNPVVLRELEGLRQTWELLDLIEMPTASTEFTTRSVSIVGGTSQVDDRLVQAFRTAVAAAITLSALGVAFLVGYASTRWLWPDRTDALTRDLSIAENLAGYRAVGTFEFLNRLDESAEIRKLAD